MPVQLSRRRALTLFGMLGLQAALPAMAFAEQPTLPARDVQRADLALLEPRPDSPPPFVAWHGEPLAQHLSLRDSYLSQGFRFISLSVYGSTSSPVYAAVMVKPSSPPSQHDYPAMSAEQWQQTFDAEAARGYGPIILTATGPAADPLFAAVFEPRDPIPLTRHGLVLAGNGVDPSTTIQGMNAQAKSQGLILRWAASYGDSGNPAFAGIWVADDGPTMWSNDSWTYQQDGQTIVAGLLDTPTTYQARFDAQTSNWCRPNFVTLNTDARYFSVFVDNQLEGGWVARHGLSPSDYQSEFNMLTQQGMYPICVQAAGPDATSARFAAIFARGRDVVPKSFTATGPVAHADIDDVVKQLMRTYATRHAGLAIVHGTKLVYARGYTLAEPGWPEAQPTTCFRLASVSKTPTAIAIYQLIEAGKLDLGTTVNSVLGLKTPAGDQPADSRFNAITIQHLLEHTSGLNPGGPGGFDDGVAVRQAFIDVGRSSSLPVTAEMTDAYIASLSLESTPGDTQVYNNCGYYLLGRVVARLRNQARPIDAFQSSLFNPLGITRIRRAVSLLADQPGDEARYQDFDLLIAQSQMSNDQPLVPDLYGNDQLEISDGAGGLSGAPTDVARLIALLLSQKDTAAIKRSTLVSMLEAGAQLQQHHSGWRSGYGLDGTSDLGTGQFYGQKGGLLDDASSVLQFDGDWGFTMLWANGRAGQLPGQGWYPDFPAVMDLAKNSRWGTKDLFPDFGIPSL